MGVGDEGEDNKMREKRVGDEGVGGERKWGKRRVGAMA